MQAVSCTHNAMIMFNDCLEVKLYVDSSNLRTIYAQNMRRSNSPFLFFYSLQVKNKSTRDQKRIKYSRHYNSVWENSAKMKKEKRLDSRRLIRGGSLFAIPQMLG